MEPMPAQQGEAEGEPGGGDEVKDDGVVVKTRKDPFDFSRNPGQLDLYFSVGNGYALDSDSINEDNAPFNQIIGDERNFNGSLAIREFGFGLGYRRSFESLGELSLLGFYYNDELSDQSLEYLRNQLTVVIPGGDPANPADVIAGYGSSSSDLSYRLGVGGEYFVPLALFLDEDANLRKGDGLRIAGQWIKAADGELRRETWYVQGSFRWSVPEWEDPKDGRKSRGLIDHRYFRSFEPLVRYGELDINLTPVPELAPLWDREQLLFALIAEVTSNVFLKAEYAINWEDTGASATFSGPDSVANNQFILELLLQF